MFVPTSCILSARSIPGRTSIRSRAPYITLGQKKAFERIVTGKDPEKLAPVLDHEEVARFLNAVDGMRNRVDAGDSLRGRFAYRRGGALEGCLYRQPTNVTPHRGCEGRPLPVRDAVPAAFGHSSRLPEAGTAPLMVVSGLGAS
jgi:hypothetical protein